MSPGLLTMLLFGSLIVVMLLGLPLAFALFGVSVVLTYFLWGLQGFFMVPLNTFRGMNSFILIAVPLFIFMANMLEHSGIAEDLYEAMYHWIGSLRGGLAMGTVLICTIFAAMSGISAVATVSMGLIALPSMAKRNYDKRIMVGCISAGGALGILIPPSVIMIILGTFAGLSVGRLFAGGLVPGLLLSFMFITYIWVRCTFQKDLGPPLPVEERSSWREKLTYTKGLILPIILVLSVLGAIFTGICTPSEAAAIGSVGSVLCAAIHRRLNWQTFKEVCYRTVSLSCMVMWIYFGALCFTSLYIAIGAPKLVEEILMMLPGGRWAPIIAMQLTFFVLGMIIDPTGIVMITTPIFFPVVRALGFDPIWFGVLFVVNMEMAYITPPFGYNLFYMKGIVPKGITMGDIYRSIIPFVLLEAVGLVIMMVFPQIILFLPNLIFG